MKDKIVQKMTILILAVILLIPTISVDAQENEVTVNVPSLKVRSGPGLTYDTIGAVTKSDKLVVIDKENDWIQVKYGSTTGWVASWYTSSEAIEMTNKQIVSKVNRLNVRTEPSTSSAVIGQLSEGDQTPAYKSEGEWIEIDFQGRKGWVNTAYITIADQSSKENTSSNIQTSEKLFVVSVDILNVRAKADLSSKQIGKVARGAQFEVLDTDHNWVKVQLDNGKIGWIYSFYGTFLSEPSSTTSTAPTNTITILYNGTNLRSDSSTNSAVVKRVDAGETFEVTDKVNDWYKVILENQSIAYVASWLVSSSNSVVTTDLPVQEKKKPRKKGTLKGLSIVIDPGHGGNDRGTTGALGTDEKDITLLTAELLSSKLQAAGANVIMTRQSDVYVDLRKRVSIGHQAGADAFISLHYDAVENSTVRGYTTYYMHGYQKKLAEYVHAGLGNMITLKDRGTQPGNYLVLRENKQNAILIELGYLSNPTEERNVTTKQFRDQATHGIYNGIIKYFDNELD
ncbi:SH3 domain-containing protein [Psychrobacillus sp. NEAU-3TGS]|uniref:SH3 domain-containing protein n=1 Tax=Psychrobacillus sp. NEAU-3TGS TaxID=2995412 RepID=UPI002498F995|nr:SH3 domain-containing protein [Psychrobacillus sp. NEAU-3TGS]MDI2588213.1 SH3 domain-containing protein [Psychrobacillus sp. NEAU-3TGS]